MLLEQKKTWKMGDNPPSPGKADVGLAARESIKQGWNTFLGQESGSFENYYNNTVNKGYLDLQRGAVNVYSQKVDIDEYYKTWEEEHRKKAYESMIAAEQEINKIENTPLRWATGFGTGMLTYASNPKYVMRATAIELLSMGAGSFFKMGAAGQHMAKLANTRTFDYVSGIGANMIDEGWEAGEDLKYLNPDATDEEVWAARRMGALFGGGFAGLLGASRFLGAPVDPDLAWEQIIPGLEKTDELYNKTMDSIHKGAGEKVAAQNEARMKGAKGHEARAQGAAEFVNNMENQTYYTGDMEVHAELGDAWKFDKTDEALKAVNEFFAAKERYNNLEAGLNTKFEARGDHQDPWTKRQMDTRPEHRAGAEVGPEVNIDGYKAPEVEEVKINPRAEHRDKKPFNLFEDLKGIFRKGESQTYGAVKDGERVSYTVEYDKETQRYRIHRNSETGTRGTSYRDSYTDVIKYLESKGVTGRNPEITAWVKYLTDWYYHKKNDYQYVTGYFDPVTGEKVRYEPDVVERLTREADEKGEKIKKKFEQEAGMTLEEFEAKMPSEKDIADQVAELRPKREIHTGRQYGAPFPNRPIAEQVADARKTLRFFTDLEDYGVKMGDTGADSPELPPHIQLRTQRGNQPLYQELKQTNLPDVKLGDEGAPFPKNEVYHPGDVAPRGPYNKVTNEGSYGAPFPAGKAKPTAYQKFTKYVKRLQEGRKIIKERILPLKHYGDMMKKLNIQKVYKDVLKLQEGLKKLEEAAAHNPELLAEYEGARKAYIDRVKEDKALNRKSKKKLAETEALKEDMLEKARAILGDRAEVKELAALESKLLNYFAKNFDSIAELEEVIEGETGLNFYEATTQYIDPKYNLEPIFSDLLTAGKESKLDENSLKDYEIFDDMETVDQEHPRGEILSLIDDEKLRSELAEIEAARAEVERAMADVRAAQDKVIVDSNPKRMKEILFRKTEEQGAPLPENKVIEGSPVESDRFKKMAGEHLDKELAEELAAKYEEALDRGENPDLVILQMWAREKGKVSVPGSKIAKEADTKLMNFLRKYLDEVMIIDNKTQAELDEKIGILQDHRREIQKLNLENKKDMIEAVKANSNNLKTYIVTRRENGKEYRGREWGKDLEEAKANFMRGKIDRVEFVSIEPESEARVLETNRRGQELKNKLDEISSEINGLDLIWNELQHIKRLHGIDPAGTRYPKAPEYQRTTEPYREFAGPKNSGKDHNYTAEEYKFVVQMKEKRKNPNFHEDYKYMADLTPEELEVEKARGLKLQEKNPDEPLVKNLEREAEGKPLERAAKYYLGEFKWQKPYPKDGDELAKDAWKSTIKGALKKGYPVPENIKREYTIRTLKERTLELLKNEPTLETATVLGTRNAIKKKLLTPEELEIYSTGNKGGTSPDHKKNIAEEIDFYEKSKKEINEAIIEYKKSTPLKPVKDVRPFLDKNLPLDTLIKGWETEDGRFLILKKKKESGDKRPVYYVFDKETGEYVKGDSQFVGINNKFSFHSWATRYNSLDSIRSAELADRIAEQKRVKKFNDLPLEERRAIHHSYKGSDASVGNSIKSHLKIETEKITKEAKLAERVTEGPATLEDIPADLARRAADNIYSDPERVGNDNRVRHANYINEVYSELKKEAEELGGTALEVLEKEFPRYHEGYNKREREILGREGDTASWFQVGSEKFPQAKMDKINNSIRNKRTAQEEFNEKAQAAIRKKMKAARGADNDLKEIRARLKRYFDYKKNYGVQGNALLQDFLIRRINNGQVEFVEQALNEFPNIFTKRNKIWKIIEGAKEKAAKPVEVKAPETYHSAPGIEIVNNHQAERIQLIFDSKPDEGTRAWLKSHGYRWSPKAGAWQRNNNMAGISRTDDFIRKFYPEAEVKKPLKFKKEGDVYKTPDLEHFTISKGTDGWEIKQDKEVVKIKDTLKEAKEYLEKNRSFVEKQEKELGKAEPTKAEPYTRYDGKREVELGGKKWLINVDRAYKYDPSQEGYIFVKRAEMPNGIKAEQHKGITEVHNTGEVVKVSNKVIILPDNTKLIEGIQTDGKVYHEIEGDLESLKKYGIHLENFNIDKAKFKELVNTLGKAKPKQIEVKVEVEKPLKFKKEGHNYKTPDLEHYDIRPGDGWTIHELGEQIKRTKTLKDAKDWIIERRAKLEKRNKFFRALLANKNFNKIWPERFNSLRNVGMKDMAEKLEAGKLRDHAIQRLAELEKTHPADFDRPGDKDIRERFWADVRDGILDEPIEGKGVETETDSMPIGYEEAETQAMYDAYKDETGKDLWEELGTNLREFTDMEEGEKQAALDNLAFKLDIELFNAKATGRAARQNKKLSSDLNNNLANILGDVKIKGRAARRKIRSFFENNIRNRLKNTEESVKNYIAEIFSLGKETPEQIFKKLSDLDLDRAVVDYLAHKTKELPENFPPEYKQWALDLRKQYKKMYTDMGRWIDTDEGMRLEITVNDEIFILDDYSQAKLLIEKYLADAHGPTGALHGAETTMSKAEQLKALKIEIRSLDKFSNEKFDFEDIDSAIKFVERENLTKRVRKMELATAFDKVSIPRIYLGDEVLNKYYDGGEKEIDFTKLMDDYGDTVESRFVEDNYDLFRGDTEIEKKANAKIFWKKIMKSVKGTDKSQLNGTSLHKFGIFYIPGLETLIDVTVKSDPINGGGGLSGLDQLVNKFSYENEKFALRVHDFVGLSYGLKDSMGTHPIKLLESLKDTALAAHGGQYSKNMLPAFADIDTILGNKLGLKTYMPKTWAERFLNFHKLMNSPFLGLAEFTEIPRQMISRMFQFGDPAGKAVMETLGNLFKIRKLIEELPAELKRLYIQNGESFFHDIINNSRLDEFGARKKDLMKYGNPAEKVISWTGENVIGRLNLVEWVDKVMDYNALQGRVQIQKRLMDMDWATLTTSKEHKFLVGVLEELGFTDLDWKIMQEYKNMEGYDDAMFVPHFKYLADFLNTKIEDVAGDYFPGVTDFNEIQGQLQTTLEKIRKFELYATENLKSLRPNERFTNYIKEVNDPLLRPILDLGLFYKKTMLGGVERSMRDMIMTNTYKGTGREFDYKNLNHYSKAMLGLFLMGWTGQYVNDNIRAFIYGNSRYEPDNEDIKEFLWNTLQAAGDEFGGYTITPNANYLTYASENLKSGDPEKMQRGAMALLLGGKIPKMIERVKK